MSTSTIRLEHDAWGRLILADADGQRHLGVTPVRAFPISEPGRSISIVSSEGHELAWIEDPAALSAESRQTLDDELAHHEFAPVIERIVTTVGDSFPTQWQVQTDRGATTIALQGEDQVRLLDSHRVLIHDDSGVRFQIPDRRRLDAASDRTLERFL